MSVNYLVDKYTNLGYKVLNNNVGEGNTYIKRFSSFIHGCSGCIDILEWEHACLLFTDFDEHYVVHRHEIGTYDDRCICIKKIHKKYPMVNERLKIIIINIGSECIKNNSDPLKTKRINEELAILKKLKEKKKLTNIEKKIYNEKCIFERYKKKFEDIESIDNNIYSDYKTDIDTIKDYDAIQLMYYKKKMEHIKNIDNDIYSNYKSDLDSINEYDDIQLTYYKKMMNDEFTNKLIFQIKERERVKKNLLERIKSYKCLVSHCSKKSNVYGLYCDSHQFECSGINQKGDPCKGKCVFNDYCPYHTIDDKDLIIRCQNRPCKNKIFRLEEYKTESRQYFCVDCLRNIQLKCIV